MIVRWHADGGHCPIHRHAATTSVIVLAGEQHLWDVEPDGSIGNHRYPPRRRLRAFHQIGAVRRNSASSSTGRPSA